jgi:hypothetical protein
VLIVKEILVENFISCIVINVYLVLEVLVPAYCQQEIKTSKQCYDEPTETSFISLLFLFGIFYFYCVEIFNVNQGLQKIFSQEIHQKQNTEFHI